MLTRSGAASRAIEGTLAQMNGICAECIATQYFGCTTRNSGAARGGPNSNPQPPDRQSKGCRTKPALRRSETAFRGSGRRVAKVNGGPVHCVSGPRQDAMEDAMSEHRIRGGGIRWLTLHGPIANGDTCSGVHVVDTLPYRWYRKWAERHLNPGPLYVRTHHRLSQMQD